MRKIFVMCACFGPALLFIPTCLPAQAFTSPKALTVFGPGAYSRHFKDVFAVAANPAALGTIKGFSAGIAAERRYLLAELNQFNVGFYQGLPRSGVGVQIGYSGFSLYNESAVGLSYGRDLGKLQLGAQFNYHRIGMAGYGSRGTVSADLAVIWQLTDKLRAGIQAINPVPVYFGTDKTEKYPGLYKLGIGYEISESCFLATEIFKETEKTPNVYLFMQYRFLQKAFLRMGFNTDVGRPFAGVGWQLKDLRLHVTGSYHPELGFTPGLMLIYEPSKQAKDEKEVI